MPKIDTIIRALAEMVAKQTIELYFDTRHTRRIALLEQVGFERGWELVDISKTLVAFQTPQWAIEAEQRLGKKGFSFDYCYEVYHPKFLAFIRDNFSERWYQHNKHYVEQKGDPKTKILALQGEEVVGFVNFTISNSRGQIRQTGILPTLRGQQIGSTLVFKAIAEMQATGATELAILSCPLGFYRIIEGEVTRTRVQLRKILSTKEH